MTSLTLVVAVLIGTGLGVLVARRIRVDGAVAPAGRSSVSTIDDEWGVVLRELERARRYERRFVLIRLPHASVVGDTGPEALLSDVMTVIRGLDYAWIDERGLHILLPEAGRAEGIACIGRVRRSIDGFDHDLARLAVFPDDGVTSGALASLLDGDADELPAPDELPQPSVPVMVLVDDPEHHEPQVS